MRLFALASFFKAKYGQGNFLPTPQIEGVKEEPSTPPGIKVEPYAEIAKGPMDTSLGVPIAADRAQKWKDKMILAYDRIKKDLTTLPFFKDIYKEMTGIPFVKNEPMLETFNKLIDAYVVNVANANLKDAFAFGVKYVDSFNSLRDMLPRMVKDREKMHKLDHAIWSTQKYIWRKVKDLLNIHDIGSGDVSMGPEEAAEMKRIIGKLPRGTWSYGPMADPTKPLFHQNRRENVKTLLKRINES
jgi:hypothetical protein